MPLTRFALKNPVAILIAVLLVAVIGAMSVTRLPVQLFPDTNRPQLFVQTFWRAASPQEMESQIVEPQEQALAGISGLEELRVNIGQGAAFLNLTFANGTDMDQALIDVVGRMNQLPPMPLDAVGPNINSGFGGGSGEILIYYFVQALPGNPREINDYSDFINNTVVPRLSALPGVANAQANWGLRPQEYQIVFDPYRAAALGVSIPEIAAALRGNTDVSGGDATIGRRAYTMRYEGEYDPSELADLVVDWRDGRPVYLRDVADARIDYGENNTFAYQNGNPAIGIQITRENGANFLAALNAVKDEIAVINESEAAELGLSLQPSFDASVFIYRAINLLRTNLALGIALAIGGLWLFLRRSRATLIISLAIPISLLATLIVLFVLGRTLNVISLAGLAFATGMVLDAAIVVMENIIRRREAGDDAHTASEKGAGQVWGALFASTTTTVAIFLPIIFLDDAEGQLFADLAITIAVGVAISMFVAVTILPVATEKWVRDRAGPAKQPIIEKLTNFLMRLTGGTLRRIGIIAGLILLPTAASWFMLPNLDYLPPVRRDAIDVFFQLPPGANPQWVDEEVASVIIERAEPYMSGEEEPALLNYYFGTFGTFANAGFRARDIGDIRALEELVRNEIIAGIPDVGAFAFRGELFGGFGQGGGIQVNLQSADQDRLSAAAVLGVNMLRERFQGTNINANPPPQATQPSLSIIPNDRRIQESGWSRAQVGTVIAALGDGQFVGEYFDGDQRLNMILRTEGWDDVQELEGIPVATPSGAIVPLGDLVDVQESLSPTGIQRVDRRRTITINISQPEGQTLEEMLDVIQNDVEPALLQALGADGSIVYGGSADSLNRAISTMLQNFAFALFILFLILAGLFRSIWDALLVMISIPLATVGGVAVLRILDFVMQQTTQQRQPLDLLTMMGFIILLGLVINNAILLVDQTRQGERSGLSRSDAVRKALRIRLRPIFMSTLTSILGMTPLLIFPGAGSEIYRGLAAAIVGGMSVSLIFTLVLIPSLLRIGENAPAHQGRSELAPAE
jgi:multidrug efflux pump subunit AcrB